MLKPDQAYLLVTFWQRQHGLLVDGIIGPKTLASFANADGPHCGQLCPGGSERRKCSCASPSNCKVSPMVISIIRYALLDEGRGEEGVNNGGSYVRALRWHCGFPEDMLGPWCAIYVSSKIKHAMFDQPSLNIPLSSLNIPLSRGAYRLVMNIGESPHGEFITVPEPGFACWGRRNWRLKREAHVRIITGYDERTDTMYYVAGNEKGKVVVGKLEHGKWRKGLIKMSTIRKAI